jgi:uncharacterized protein (TIGR02145 family)
MQKRTLSALLAGMLLLVLLTSASGEQKYLPFIPPLLLNSFTVTPSAGENGTISPDTAQIVRKGDRTSFTVTPATNYTIESVGGTCGGSLEGNTYTTDAVTANCTVEASFTILTYTVTPSAGENGTISPDTAQVVRKGDRTSFTVTPATNYTIESVGGTCGGSLDGNAYTTDAVTADCTVEASFTILTYTVTPSARENGTINPDKAQVIASGGTISFTIIPDIDFAIVDPVGGTCGGSLVGNTYTTDAVTADCTVEANFIESNAEFDYISVVTDPGRNEWDVPLSAEEPLVLEVSVTQPGIWSATTDTVNGVTYRGSGTFSGQGNQMISLYGSGTPLAYGVHSYSVAGSGLSTNVTTICASYLAPENTEIVEVTGAAGRVWMDRNLGAHRAAETFNDCRAYGNNFQWGRLADGHHEIEWYSDSSAARLNGSTATGTSFNNDQPPTDQFIVPSGSYQYDWRNPKNDDLWQDGLNDPCPTGFRLPTTEEWQAETAAAGIEDGYDAFNSTLKMTFTGYWGVYDYQQTNIRHAGDPANDSDSEGNYWSSSPATSHGGRGAHNFYFTRSYISHGGPYRGYGLSVRCIEDLPGT